MKARGTVVLAAALFASCAHRVETSHSILQAPGAQRQGQAVPAVMERQVRNAVDAGDGDVRVRTLRARVAADPADLDSRLQLAAIYDEQGYPELAIEHYRFAAARFPDRADVALRLARAFRSVELEGEARSTLASFLARHADAGELHNALGVLLDEAGELSAAESELRTAVQQLPRNDALHNNLGYNLLLQGRAAEAAAEFRQALTLRPRSEIARNNLGAALAMMDSKEAVIQWQSVSGPASAHNNLAAILIEQGKYNEARNELARALEYQKNHGPALANLKLLSELDGGAAEFVPPVRRKRGVWGRVGHGLARVMGSPADPVNPSREEIVKR